jgi:YVTN family beta-propeller protein
MRHRAAALVVLVLLLLAAFPAAAATLLIANKSGDTVDLFGLDRGRSIATLPTGHAPHEVAVAPDGRRAAISNYGPRGEPGSTLTILDVKQKKVLRTIDLGEHHRPHGMAWFAKNRLAVTTEDSEHMLVVNPKSGEIVTAVETGQEISHMVAVTPDGGRAFVANIGSGSVTAIDLETGRKIRDIATGDGAEGITITPDGREVWVANRGADTLTILDPRSLEIVAEIPCKGFPIRVAVTPDGRRALVSCADTGEVALFDVRARKELARSKLDLSTVPDAATRLFGDRFGDSPVPVGIVISADGGTAWVAATQADVVVVLDTATLQVKDLIEAGEEPDGMALTPVRAGGKRS